VTEDEAYKAMYKLLLDTDLLVIEMLKKAHEDAEEIFMNATGGSTPEGQN
jgi:CRISPR/Cas system-associated protein Csm6